MLLITTVIITGFLLVWSATGTLLYKFYGNRISLLDNTYARYLIAGPYSCLSGLYVVFSGGTL